MKLIRGSVKSRTHVPQLFDHQTLLPPSPQALQLSHYWKISSHYLEVWVLVLVNTGWDKHGPAINLLPVQLQRFLHKDLALKLHVAVPAEGALGVVDRADLLDEPAALENVPQLLLRVLQAEGQVAYKDAQMVLAAVVGDLLDWPGCSPGFLSCRHLWSLLEGSLPTEHPTLRLHRLIPLSPVLLGGLFWNREDSTITLVCVYNLGYHLGYPTSNLSKNKIIWSEFVLSHLTHLPTHPHHPPPPQPSSSLRPAPLSFSVLSSSSSAQPFPPPAWQGELLSLSPEIGQVVTGKSRTPTLNRENFTLVLLSLQYTTPSSAQHLYHLTYLSVCPPIHSRLCHVKMIKWKYLLWLSALWLWTVWFLFSAQPCPSPLEYLMF